MEKQFHKPSPIRTHSEEKIDRELKRLTMRFTDFGEVNYLRFFNKLKYEYRLFNRTNGTHPKERFNERVSGTINFRCSKLYTVVNNLHDRPQVYKIVHSHSSHKNIVFAVTTERFPVCKTVMTDMRRNNLDKMKEKLASEFLESTGHNSGRSADKIRKTRFYDYEENYIAALRALGFDDLSVPGVKREIAELRRRLAQKAQQ